jgi:hypothetical protein
MLKRFDACSESVQWYEARKTTDPEKLFKLAMRAKRYSDVNWMLTRLMTKRQRVMYAIYAAEQVLHIYEKHQPNDDRPRKAIEAARAYLKRPRKETKAAAGAAGDAAWAAAGAAGAAAGAAAWAAADAAWAAAWAAADAARAAGAAAGAAAEAAAGAAGAAYTKILKYGYSLLHDKS